MAALQGGCGAHLTEKLRFPHSWSMAKPALGRGLSGLLGGVSPLSKPTAAAPSPSGGAPAAATVQEGGVRKVEISRIVPCPFQPRKDFAPEALQELADSIRVEGVIQPLLVRAQGDRFEIIAGERRWRAAQLAGLKELPILVREADDREVMQLALIENLQRENLNPIEEALGFADLIERFQLRQEDAAGKVGKSRAAVANALRLLKLPPAIQEHLRHQRLTTGHAKVLLGLEGADRQSEAADKILKQGLNVRQTEELIAHLQAKPEGAPVNGSPSAHNAPMRDPNIVAVESKLRDRLGTKVNLRYSKGKGALDIRFFSDDELERILDLLGIKVD